MATGINDGGPVFPTIVSRNEAGNTIAVPAHGMSLRDWFAGQATMPTDGISETWAVAIMGSKPPDWLLDDKMECIRWWAEAEARARYISADAMLKARES